MKFFKEPFKWWFGRDETRLEKTWVVIFRGVELFVVPYSSVIFLELLEYSILGYKYHNSLKSIVQRWYICSLHFFANGCIYIYIYIHILIFKRVAIRKIYILYIYLLYSHQKRHLLDGNTKGIYTYREPNLVA